MKQCYFYIGSNKLLNIDKHNTDNIIYLPLYKEPIASNNIEYNFDDNLDNSNYYPYIGYCVSDDLAL